MTLIVHTFVLNRDTNPTVGLQGMFETVRYSKIMGWKMQCTWLYVEFIQKKDKVQSGALCVWRQQKATSHRDHELAIFENRIMAATTHVMACEK